jgi:hypothetical protein
MGWVRHRRKREAEEDTPAVSVLDRKSAAEVIDDRARDGQAEPGPARMVGGVKRVEQVAEIVLGDRRPAVLDVELNGTAEGTHAQRHQPFGRGKRTHTFDGTREEIENDLTQLRRAPDDLRRRRKVELDLRALAKLASDDAEGNAQDVVKVRVLERTLTPRCHAARDLQDALDPAQSVLDGAAQISEAGTDYVGSDVASRKTTRQRVELDPCLREAAANESRGSLDLDRCS